MAGERPDDINRDYGRRGYVSTNPSPHVDRMQKVTDRAVLNEKEFKHSEFKKPYFHDDFWEMEYWHSLPGKWQPPNYFYEDGGREYFPVDVNFVRNPEEYYNQEDQVESVNSPTPDTPPDPTDPTPGSRRGCSVTCFGGFSCNDIWCMPQVGQASAEQIREGQHIGQIAAGGSWWIEPAVYVNIYEDVTYGEPFPFAITIHLPEEITRDELFDHLELEVQYTDPSLNQCFAYPYFSCQCECDGEIIYTTEVMVIGEVQNLIANRLEGSRYNCRWEWSLVGKGSIEPADGLGDTCIYKAPDDVVGCTDKATIYLRPCEGNGEIVDALTITLSNGGYEGIPAKGIKFYDDDCIGNEDGPCCSRFFYSGGTPGISCRGNAITLDCSGDPVYWSGPGLPCLCDGDGCDGRCSHSYGSLVNPVTCDLCHEYISCCFLSGYSPGGWNDLRTPEMIEDGCCISPL